MIVEDDLAHQWRAARPTMAGVHLDSAACSRQSNAVIDAAAQHARHEAEVGGYIAAQAAAPVLAAGRSAIGVLTGTTAADVAFTTGSQHALGLLLASWPGERRLACLPGEFGPNLAVMAAHRFAVQALPVDIDGRVRVADLPHWLRTERPALLHLTGLASHRGVAQPIAEVAECCAQLDVPLVLDAAQALAQLDCAGGASAVYSSSRKWMAGPRGVGFLAVRPELAARLVRRLPPPDWDLPISALQSYEYAEANIAARVGYSLALGEHLAAGPDAIRSRLAAIGRASREALDGVAGWRVVEQPEEPTAITTLVPPDGIDPVAVRAALIAGPRIVTTVAEVARAPFELSGPVLRVSPHVDVIADDLELLVDGMAKIGSGIR